MHRASDQAAACRDENPWRLDDHRDPTHAATVCSCRSRSRLTGALRPKSFRTREDLGRGRVVVATDLDDEPVADRADPGGSAAQCHSMCARTPIDSKTDHAQSLRRMPSQ